MSAIKIAVVGASGRMGRSNIAAIAQSEAFVLVGAYDRTGVEALGVDAGVLVGEAPLGVVLSDDRKAALGEADVVIDFTMPAATIELAKYCADRTVAHVIGTTGFTQAEEKELGMASSGGRTVKAGNMSLGINLLSLLVEKAAAALDEDFDIEVLEMHHRMKVDAPSGTALMLGEAAAKGRGIDLAAKSVRVRDGITGARQRGDIGFATLRGGGVVGEHSVILANESERIEISHRAENRGLFSNGALKAAAWLVGQKPGFYSMRDVLGF